MDAPSDARVAHLLRSAHRIAIVGLSGNPERPSYNVARYLLEYGYEIVPVNPNENEVLGRRAYPRLTNVPQQIDLVNIFRRPSGIPDAVRGAIAVGAFTVWMQLGVVHEEAAAMAENAGLAVVMDRCLMSEHARLVLHGTRIA